MLNPEALVRADSMAEAEKKFLAYAEKHLEKYKVEIHTITKSTMGVVID